MKIIQKILADPRVEAISNEKIFDDGFWVVLKDGYTVDDCYLIHERTPSKCFKRLKDIKPKI